MFHRVISLLLICATCFGCQRAETLTPAAVATPVAPAQKNVLLIVLDDANWTDYKALKPDGSPVMKNTIEQIAQQGTTFVNHVASNSVCCPSRCSLLTGQYSHHTGVWANDGAEGGFAHFDPSNTVMTDLQKAGYTTGQIGSYLNGYAMGDPTPPGYSYWYASPNHSYFDYDVNNNGTWEHHGSADADYHTDVMTAKTIRFIKQHAQDPAPWALKVSYTTCHEKDPFDVVTGTAPVPAPRDLNTLSALPFYSPPDFDAVDVSTKPHWVKQLPHLSGSQIAKIELYQQRRLECLLSADVGIQRIMQTLSDRGVLDNTIVVFTSDNGFHQGEHRLATPQHSKEDAYEQASCVPLVIRVPGKPGAQVCQEAVCNVDITSTIYALTGVVATLPQDGLSLVPLIDHPSALLPRAGVLLESDSHLYLGVRRRDDCYIETYTPLLEFEYYNLVSDPFEVFNAYVGPMDDLHQILIDLSTH